MGACLCTASRAARSTRFLAPSAWISMRFSPTSRRARTTCLRCAGRSRRPTCSKRWRTRRSTSLSWRQRWSRATFYNPSTRRCSHSRSIGSWKRGGLLLADPFKGAAYLDAQREARPRISTPRGVRDELKRVHREGLGRGDCAGWPSIDKLYSVAPGQVTTVTGWPNSGKSQWLDALALNLARQGWRFVFCSLENIPVFLHVDRKSVV